MRRLSNLLLLTCLSLSTACKQNPTPVRENGEEQNVNKDSTKLLKLRLKGFWAEDCAAGTLHLQDEKGLEATPSDDVTVDLRGPEPGRFFSDKNCSDRIEQVTLSAGSHSIAVYYQDDAPGIKNVHLITPRGTTTAQITVGGRISDLYRGDRRRPLYVTALGPQLVFSYYAPRSSGEIHRPLRPPSTITPSPFPLPPPLSSSPPPLKGTVAPTSHDRNATIWVTDGTPEGTRPLPGSTSRIGAYARLKDHIYFNQSGELYTYDGHETYLVKDIYPGRGKDSVPKFFTELHGQLIFAAGNSEVGYELWTSDGTEQSTVLLKDLRPGPESSWPKDLTRIADHIYFRAKGPQSPHHLLWRTDGTPQGTQIVSSVNTGPRYFSQKIIQAGSAIYFWASDPLHGQELWKTDGSQEGAVLVKDIHTGSFSTHPRRSVAVNDSLFFTVHAGRDAEHLWRSHSQGTTRLTPFQGEPTSGHYRDLTAFKGKLLFRMAGKSPEADGLWAIDENLTPQKLPTAPVGGFISPLTLHEESAYFWIWSPKDHRHSLWQTNGTPQGTRKTIDLPTGFVHTNKTRFIGNTLLFIVSPEGDFSRQDWWVFAP